MEQSQLFIKIALHAWEMNIKRTTAIFDSLTDEQLLTEIAPGRNRGIYILGHLVAVHDMMLPLLDLGQRQYLQLDEAFISNPDKAITDLPPVQDLRAYWTSINQILREQFNKLTPEEWLQKHTMISDEDFAKEPHRNRLSVLLNRTNHNAYHQGQLAWAKNK
ncbi:DinB family protein [Chitinophaga sp. GbtcB8]|uniref:DinB family protein n=1 Tax=Chitinophaga sp. GbtcB8 TaxID=2824753 RepID=UPI001C2FC6C6|nr:DinB family protein [Chitinophaga sp. GbtcB8]